jgi:hypothetical protein
MASGVERIQNLSSVFRLPWMALAKSGACLFSLACCAALAGCETNSVASGTRFVVAVPNAAFYKYGPAQTFGPDFTLSQDTEVTIIQHSEGLSHVRTADGTGGYMYNEDLKPAPPKAPTPEEAASARHNLRPLFPQKPELPGVQPNFHAPLFEEGAALPSGGVGTSKPHP